MEWISVEDILPENSSWNLIVTGDMVTMAFFEMDGHGNYYWLCHNDAEDKDEWEGVTNWMPLPEPPEL